MSITDNMRKSLRSYYDKIGYKLFEEVKRSSGYMKPERFADAIAISIFPSNGISLTGFEMKENRADLLNDLRDLSKSEALKQFCDYWILMIPHSNYEEILKGKIQIPDDWGVWAWYNNKTHGNGGFIVKIKPKQLYPKPVDRYFLASLLNQTNTSVKEKYE